MQLIIFDFDGTLADSRRLIIEAHRRVFSEFGLPVPTPEASLALIGRSLDLVLAELAGPEAPIAAMIAAYQPLVKELRADPAFADLPFAGVHELLVDLGTRDDLRLGIATGHVSSAIEPALETFGWRKLFCTVQSADKAPSKPHPGMILQALDEAGIDASNAVMIGDTAFDMEMARAAGVTPIGVGWGYHARDRLTAAGAAWIADTIEDLRTRLVDQCRRGE
jgi:phosphoglycolate phosphatase